jgi:hypothetical protein
MSKTHLPVTETQFDALMFRVVRAIRIEGDERFAQALTDDELLVLSELNETIESSDEGRALAANLRGWPTVIACVEAEIENR